MRKRYTKKPQAFGTYKPRFADYEQKKREWVSAHPNATPEEYQNAMVRIAQQCGI